MRFSPRTWSLLSVLLFIAAAFFWLKGNEVEAQRRLRAPASPAGAPAPATNANSAGPIDLLAPKNAASAGLSLARLGFKDEMYPLRLRNTARSVDDLVREDRALLLANALIDTATGGEVEIPEHLRAGVEPGSYIVQWQGPATPEFRALLDRHQARIVSYVPNNAYLVKADREQAEALRASTGVQRVLPFEPYYKLEQGLLALAVEQQPLPGEMLLRLTLVPGTMQEAQQEIAALGAQVLAEENSPFGPQVIIQPPLNALSSLARLASVQGIEPDLARQPSSDFSRTILGVATNSAASNYLNLTGSNVWVNVNDVSIDTNHPGLRSTTFGTPPFPVSTNVLNADPDGHGTFVANLIAGSGAQGPTGTNVPSGSATNASFRGIAPKAKLFAQPIDPAGEELYPKVKDTWLIETAAATNYLSLRRTNSLISNNSWNYDGAGYDSAAARYDAAVRDALPGTSGSQALLFVFAAGNSGFGDEEGAGGQLGRIQSPGSAKNVITVGALETPRLIQISYTNKIVTTNLDDTVSTNDEVVFPFAGSTDSSNQVASYSSRGNVGIGIEGNYGRFKPDVVAPGTMLVSAKSRGWNITNSVDTNTPFGGALAQLQTNSTEYRFDSGTTFAAANVSGMLALIQEYFESQAPAGQRGARMSPALMKGLLINGARSLTEYYDIAVNAAANYQGWGLPFLPATLSSFSTNSHSSIVDKRWRLRFSDQSPAEAVATGESRTWKITLSTNASVQPLRVTLVWTDPPGNPAVGVKLVNDLDLIITNTETKTVFYGNNFFPGSDFTEATPPDPEFEAVDFVNNVENILIRNPKQYGREFTVTVRGRRVNVNAISDYMAATGRTNDVVQDFALVVASDLGSDPSLNISKEEEPPDGVDFSEVDVFDAFDAPTSARDFVRAPLEAITNGLPRLTERVGANPTHFGTNGSPSQWRFYVFTNVGITNEFITAEAGTNVAFVTFNPPNLSRPREIEADIDVYVSKDPNLTNLVPSVLRAALKSLEPGGTETVVLSNAVVGDLFYIGVKSEDQQAAEFSIMGISRNGPFEEERNGRIILNGVPISGVVLDGSPNRPTAATFVAIGLNSRRVARTIVTNQVTHENFGDLVGVLAHQSVRTVLNNHSILGGFPTITNRIIAYDDFSFGPLTGSRPSDGPGSLADFSGTKIVGSWIFEMIDNAPSHTGLVQQVTVAIDPLQNQLLHAQAITVTNQPNETLFFPIDVGVNVTSLDIRVSDVSLGGRLELLLRRGSIPQTNVFDFRQFVPPGVGFIYPSGPADEPISPGTYFLAVRNLNPSVVSYKLTVTFSFDNSTSNSFNFPSGSIMVSDDARSGQTIRVSDDKVVAGLRVGVNMKHPRSSDVVLSLLSPQGTRVLLAENRGYTNAAGFGTLVLSTNNVTNITTLMYHTVFTDDTNLARLPLKFVDLGGPVGLSGIPSMTNGFERATNGNYLGGTRVDGWDVIPSGGQVSVITGDSYAHSGSNLLSLGTTGIIRTNVAVTRDQAHKLRFAVRGAPMMTLFNTGVDDAGVALPVGSIDPHYRIVSGNTNFPGPDALVFSPLAGWNANNATSRWIAPFATVPTQKPIRQYRYRTYINLYEQSTLNAVIRFKWAVEDDFTGEVLLNGFAQSVPAVPPGGFTAAPFRSISPANPGLNILEFVTDDSIGAMRVEVDPTTRLAPKDPDPSVAVTIGGVPRPSVFASTNGWQIVTMDFVPTSVNTPITIASEFGEVWIDSVSVEKTGDIFVRPEEPLELIQGERALGDWTLEARDARTGAVLPASDVLSWKLTINYAQPNILAERLPGGSNFPLTPPQINLTNRMRGGVLFTNQVHYFAIYPCADASEVTVTLSGLNNFDAIEMLADHSGLPTGDPDTDDFVPLRNNENPGSPGGRAVFKLTWDEPAPARLTPGKPFFLALRNRFLNATNVYLLKVDSDASCNLPPPPPLLANQTVQSVASAASTGEGTEGDTFEVNVETGASSVSFAVQSEGDTMIVAQKGTAPTRYDYTHIQNNAGAGNEVLTINSSSSVPLSPGLWYVRVLNNTDEALPYSITATGDISAPAAKTEIHASLSGGAIRLVWNATLGTVYRVESSMNLETWMEAGTVTAESATAEFSESTGGISSKFYRVRRD